MEKPRIAASTYLNSAPLVYIFTEGPLKNDYIYLPDVAPSRCAAMLRDKECEIALIPVIEYQRIPNLSIIPNICVGAHHQVKSVLLASKVPIQHIKRVTLDASSRTSQSLVKILLEKKYNLTPEYIERMPDPSLAYQNIFSEIDAALIIGDPAMKIAAAKEQYEVTIYDLAEEWIDYTGLPFVFAVWAVRDDAVCDRTRIVSDFLKAKGEGISKIDELAARYARDLKLKQEDLCLYLRDNISFTLDEDFLNGMKRYFELASELQLISTVKPIKQFD